MSEWPRVSCVTIRPACCAACGQGEDAITVSGRPVAVLTPVRPRRRRWLSKTEFLSRLRGAQADPGLRNDLAVRRRHDRGSRADPVSTTPAAGVLDTSVFIATESGRQLDEGARPGRHRRHPRRTARRRAGRDRHRAQRLATLESVADMETLPVDDDAARMWARLRIHLPSPAAGCGTTTCGSWAVAASRALPVITQDDDFAALDGAASVEIIRV